MKYYLIKMIKNATIVIYFLISNLKAQIPDISYISATEAANLLVGDNVYISNASFLGNPAQLAHFTNGLSKVGFSSGVLLTTGDASFATEWGCSGCRTEKIVSNNIYDADLNILNGYGSVKSPAILEFDFISTGTLLEFEFVFSSMEYPEFVDSDFNDVFGFFLSGPGISGIYSNNSENIAQLPNGIDISINTVNHLRNSYYYINNPYFNQGVINENNALFRFDGKTKVIKVKKEIECSQTYHLKIAICNTRDQNFDSGIFLKQGSIRSDFQLGSISANIQPICEGQNMNLTVQGENGWTYTWSDGQNGVNLRSITTPANLNNSSYSVTATNLDNCSLTKTIDVSVHSMDNIPPYINGINNSGNYTTTVQAKKQICFDIPSFDNINERVEISATNLPTGSSFIANDAFHETGRFCWTPNNSDIGIHTFNIKVSDKNVCEAKEANFTIKIKVVCGSCPINIYYENRIPNNNPLPQKTIAGIMIMAGESVDLNQTDGLVNTGSATVEFRAPMIILRPGFIAGSGFSAILDDETCIDECNDCCKDWTGFTYDFIPNIITPNGDGKNDFWYIHDKNNPFCAFNAQGFYLEIINRWGVIVKSSSFSGNSCCPFTAPSTNNQIPHSSIYWDGKTNGGNFVSNGTYSYVLTLISCNQQKVLSGYITVVGSESIEETDKEVIEIDTNALVNNKQLKTTMTKEVNKEIRVTPVLQNPREIKINKEIDSISNINPSIYPNPTQNSITIDLISPNNTIEVLTIYGQILISRQSNTLKEIIDLSTFSKGLYLIRITSNNNINEQKVIKQ
jgi:hypothetical protein